LCSKRPFEATVVFALHLGLGFVDLVRDTHVEPDPIEGEFLAGLGFLAGGEMEYPEYAYVTRVLA
jgi:hypothetical protein